MKNKEKIENILPNHSFLFSTFHKNQIVFPILLLNKPFKYKGNPESRKKNLHLTEEISLPMPAVERLNERTKGKTFS